MRQASAQRPRAAARSLRYVPDLIDSLEEAQAARRLTQHLKTLTHPPLLVVDELGYLLVTRSGAIFFFQLINRRYGRASTVLTSNKGFEERGRILGDEVIARRAPRPLAPPLPHRQQTVRIQRTPRVDPGAIGHEQPTNGIPRARENAHLPAGGSAYPPLGGWPPGRTRP